jgi:hypothetical protein
MCIRVNDIPDGFASCPDAAQILDQRSDLEEDDLKACLTFAHRRIDHPLLAECRYGWPRRCHPHSPMDISQLSGRGGPSQLLSFASGGASELVP